MLRVMIFHALIALLPSDLDIESKIAGSGKRLTAGGK
jgi:hypothetical protein